ncbi:MAG TPA: cytochrome b/b6 domain-containing protein [Gammaproteobacteria bacterium]|nr:cytochrome b/b6 domain-containing protein [Gammaproteobacteria bacterium]
MSFKKFRYVEVWDTPTRVFHWVNVLLVILVTFTGFTFMFRDTLGLHGGEIKMALMKYHTIIGYVFVVNLVGRLLWAFFGNQHARWRAFLPGKGWRSGIVGYLKDLSAGRPRPYLGHTPPGRVAVTLMLAVLVVLSLTGLIRASTDLYYPPAGSLIAAYIARPGIDPATLQPGNVPEANSDRYLQVKSIRGIFGRVHVLATYVLLVLVILHVYAVVITERYKGGIVSAMISGRKLLDEAQPPADAEKS